MLGWGITRGVVGGMTRRGYTVSVYMVFVLLGLHAGVGLLGRGRTGSGHDIHEGLGRILSLYTLEIEDRLNSSAFSPRLPCEPQSRLPSRESWSFQQDLRGSSAPPRSTSPPDLNRITRRHGRPAWGARWPLKASARDGRFIQGRVVKGSHLHAEPCSAGMLIPGPPASSPQMS